MTLYNVQKRNWKLFSLKQRFAGAFPRITVVPFDKQSKRSSFWISMQLQLAIADRLNKKEQVILFINRRGYSFFVQCTGCTFVFSCAHCSVSLTLHEYDKLICHYCGVTQNLPTQCISCSSSSLLKKGIGTQQVVTVIQKLFPHARIGRADLDATVNKKKWQATLQSFSTGELDILVGTQTIIKGYHFPRVTLVGVIWADSNLHLPLYHATETTMQQLLQVAGRAGRSHTESDVIVQTMTNHPLFSYLQETAYPLFCDYEMAHRKLLDYPPYTRLAYIEFRHEDESIVDNEAQQCYALLRDYITLHNVSVVLLGPAPPAVYKIKKVFIRVLYLKGPNAQQLALLFNIIPRQAINSAIFFTQNPLS